MASCIFCKIIKGEIPSLKLFESERIFAFMDIEPVSAGHSLIIPKYHGAKLTDIPDEALTEVLVWDPPHDLWDTLGLRAGKADNEQPVAKKIAIACGLENYNLLQNNGRLAHQVVDHVHFHVIPKPNEKEGLGVGWPAQETDMEKLKALHSEIKAKM